MEVQINTQFFIKKVKVGVVVFNLYYSMATVCLV